MKKIITKAAALFFTVSLFAEGLSGYEIAKKADNLPEPDTASYSATLTLTDKNGKSRVREILMREKDYGDTKKSVIIFQTPKDVAGTGYLSFEYDEKADGTKQKDDNWLYMPALKKARRISGSDTDGDFMGTDFTYDDMGDRSLNEDDWELLGEETVAGVQCWKVNSISKDKKIKNPRRVCYFAKDSYVLYKCEFYDRQDKLQRVLTCEKIELLNGYWTTGIMKMSNVQTKHSTTYEMKDVVYNQPLNDSQFTVAALERGTVK